MDVHLQVNAMSVGRELQESEKITIAISYLENTPQRQYDTKTTKDGPFATYEDFRSWIRQYYCPPDLLARYRYEYREIAQDDNESLHNYQLRFEELVNRLDERPSLSWQVSDFIVGLRRKFRDRLDKYDDMSDFKNVTVQQIVERIMRSMRLARPDNNHSNSHSSNSKEHKPKPLEH